VTDSVLILDNRTIVRFDDLEIQALIEASQITCNEMLRKPEDWKSKDWSKNKIKLLENAIYKLKGHGTQF
jgi:hypothetical protein